jgi:oligoribonuclease (3'-5' exoribonuclease)
MNYIWFDTETGGLNPKVHSLLTAYFAICDKDLNLIDELELQLKPSDLSKLNLTQEAMNVNKINIDEHLKDPNTITYEEGRVKLKQFLLKNKIKGKRKSFMPAGHNIQFDKEMIWEQLMPQDEFEEEVHYRTIDTSNICNFLKDVEILPDDVGNLESLVDLFKVAKRETHNAKGDVLMNIEVYRAMKAMMKAKKQEMIGGTNSLLEIIEA